MDKIQKIRGEVEKLFNHVKDSNFESDLGAFYYLKDLLDFIDSLQEEPVSEELDKEIERYYADWDEKPRYIQTACHFANWQKQKTIDKAAEWLKCAGKYHWYDPIEHNEGFGTDRLIEDFKKYMEDKQ